MPTIRGKILRIHPEDDGSYTIRKSIPKDRRPEIYTMGHRNPWRVSTELKTGYILLGEVGPDASEETPSLALVDMTEFMELKGPGFGWPYFIGDNKPYSDF
ncbi:MAG: PQQ-dependent sugar dehydrogenase [Bacteroidia bacterium]